MLFSVRVNFVFFHNFDETFVKDYLAIFQMHDEEVTKQKQLILRNISLDAEFLDIS